MEVVCWLLLAYWLILIARIVLSWIPVPMSGPFRRVVELIYALTEPVLKPLRGLLPPVRLGAVGLDLSPIIVFIVLGILRSVICRAA